MADISLNTSSPEYSFSITSPDYAVELSSPSIAVSLSRVGGQGSKGDSVSDVYTNESNELIIEVSNSAGTLVDTYNLGTIFNTTTVVLTQAEYDALGSYNPNTVYIIV